MASPRTLIASIHDVSPRFESEVDGLIDLLKPHVGNRLAMLVVPNHWGSSPIVPGSAFATRLRSWASAGAEMFLHGFYHRDDAVHRSRLNGVRARLMTAREGEFLGLSTREAALRIAKGRRLIEDVIGRPIAGFVAPAWLYGQGAMQALAEEGISIAENHLRVWSPETGEQLARGPVITWATRTPMRRRSSLAAAFALRHVPISTLRVGVHPPDIRDPIVVRSIERTLCTAARGRRPMSYGDLRKSSQHSELEDERHRRLT